MQKYWNLFRDQFDFDFKIGLFHFQCLLFAQFYCKRLFVWECALFTNVFWEVDKFACSYWWLVLYSYALSTLAVFLFIVRLIKPLCFLNLPCWMSCCWLISLSIVWYLNLYFLKFDVDGWLIKKTFNNRMLLMQNMMRHTWLFTPTVFY